MSIRYKTQRPILRLTFLTVLISCAGFVADPALAQPPATIFEPDPIEIQDPPPGAVEPQIVLAPSGLAADAQPESVLPAGALVHLRINGLQKLLDDASDMAMPFVPEKAVGPMAEVALEEPNPLLAMIGMQTMGQPMSVDMLSQMSGIDPGRPVTLTFYLDDPTKAFALCVPVDNLDAFSGLLANAFPPRDQPESITLEGGTALAYEFEDLHLHIVCSEDQVAICGSPQLAQALLIENEAQKLGQSNLIADAINKHQDDNVLLAVDTAPAKAFLPMLDQFRQIPPEQIAQIRREILSELDEDDLEQFNRQLATRFGIRDVEQLMDYVECLATGSYEVLFEQVYQFVEESQGLTLAIDLEEEFQSFELSLLSESIRAESATRALPLQEAKQAFSKIPGDKNFLVACGQAAPPKKWKWLDVLIERIGQKMEAKDLPMELHSTFRDAYDGHTPVPTLESRVDWTIATRFFTSGKWPHEYDSLTAYFSESLEQSELVSLKAIPPQEDDFLEKHFAEKAKITNTNYANWATLRERLNANPTWFIQSSRSDSEKLENGITKLVYEDNFKTRGGLFGYNEHELINRYFTLYRNDDNLTLLWPGGNNPETFAALKPQPTSDAFNHLLEQANLPENVQRIEHLRSIHLALDLVDYVASVETLLHQEMEAYLDQIQALAAQIEEEGVDVVVKKMEALEMPIQVARVNWNDNEQQAYLVTPVGWTYPRPKIVPEAVALFKDFRDKSDAIGGVLAHHSTHDGRYDLVVVQSTSGISHLIRSVGNNIAETYIKNPAAQGELEQLFYNERDESADGDETILTSTIWSFLD